MSRTPRNLWTPEEDEIIRADFADYIDVRVIAAKLGRDFGTLRQRLYTLKLRRDRTVFKMMKWCPEHLKPLLKEKGSAAFIEAVDRHSRQLEQTEASRTSKISAAMDAQIAAIEASPELERREKMAAMRAIGMTLESIGERFSVSRERVRQLTDHDFMRPAAARTGSIKNLASINARLEAKIADNTRRIKEKQLNEMVDLWNEASDDTRGKFLAAIGKGEA